MIAVPSMNSDSRQRYMLVIFSKTMELFERVSYICGRNEPGELGDTYK